MKKILYIATLLITTLTYSQDVNFELESDYVVLEDKSSIGMSSSLQKQGGNLIWTRTIEGKQRMTFFGILQSNTTQWDTATKTGTIKYIIEGNGIEGQLTIEVQEAQENNQKVTLQISNFINKTTTLTLHLTHITIK